MKNCFFDYATRSIADLVDYYGKGMLLTRINVPKAHRGNGFARRLLQDILDAADSERVTLFLEISPSDGLTYDQLQSWYERHEFVEFATGIWRRLPKN